MKEFTLPYSKKKATLNSTPLTAGGNCDFSTAEVTIIDDIVGLPMCYIMEKDSISENVPPVSLIFATARLIANTKYTVPLYKGHLQISNENNLSLSVSGNITDLENRVFDITGDCTISIGD